MLHHFAYLDAGTGSLFIQAFMGFVLAISVALRRTLQQNFAKLKAVITRSAKSED